MPEDKDIKTFREYLGSEREERLQYEGHSLMDSLRPESEVPETHAVDAWMDDEDTDMAMAAWLVAPVVLIIILLVLWVIRGCRP